MGFSWSRNLKLFYRQRPLMSIMVTAGVVDILMGGWGDRPSLIIFGMGVIGVGIAVRGWHRHPSSPTPPIKSSQVYLPTTGSRPQLPPLSSKKTYPNR